MRTYTEAEERRAFETEFEGEDDCSPEEQTGVDLCYSRNSGCYKNAETQAMFLGWSTGRNRQRKDYDQLSAERKSFEDHFTDDVDVSLEWDIENQRYKKIKTDTLFVAWQAARKMLRVVIMGTD